MSESERWGNGEIAGWTAIFVLKNPWVAQGSGMRQGKPATRGISAESADITGTDYGRRMESMLGNLG